MNVPNYGWTISGKNAFTRPLTAVEAWMRSFIEINTVTSLPGREHFGMTTYLKLKFPETISDPIPYLHRAWLVTRYHHPHLGTDYHPSSGTLRAEPLDQSLWLKTFIVHSGSAQIHADRLMKRSHLTSAATAQWIPDTCELVLSVSHLIVDGLGLLKTSQIFLASLASVIEKGLDADIDSYMSSYKYASLSPGLNGIIEAEVKEAPGANIKNTIDTRNSQYQKDLPGMSFPIRKGSENAPPSDTERAFVTLDKDTSVALKKACSKRGVSLAAVVNTAIIRSMMTFPQNSGTENTLLYLVPSIRHLLPVEFNSAELSVGVYMYHMPFSIPNVHGNSFSQLLSKVDSVYKSDLKRFAKDDEGRAVNFAQLIPEFVKSEAELLSKLDPGLLPLRVPILSSMGLLERHFQREYKIGESQDQAVVVEDVKWAADQLGPLPFFHQFSFRDKITVQVCFNESYYEVGFMQQVLESMVDDILWEFQIKAHL